MYFCSGTPMQFYSGVDTLNDFQKLSDEAFRSMKGKYYRPADLIADMQSRRFFRLQSTRAVDPNSASVNR